MLIKDLNGGFVYNKNFDLKKIDENYIQIIDDNSELGKKIISMIPYVKLIYKDGKVIDCEKLPEPEVIDTETDLQQLVIQQQYELEMLKLGIDI